MNIQKRSREQIVAKVAQDIPTGSFVIWVLVYRHA